MRLLFSDRGGREDGQARGKRREERGGGSSRSTDFEARGESCDASALTSQEHSVTRPVVIEARYQDVCACDIGVHGNISLFFTFGVKAAYFFPPSFYGKPKAEKTTTLLREC